MELNQVVTIEVSGQQGKIIASAYSISQEPRHLVRYKNGAGDAVEIWWDEDALEPSEIVG